VIGFGVEMSKVKVTGSKSAKHQNINILFVKGAIQVLWYGIVLY